MLFNHKSYLTASSDAANHKVLDQDMYLLVPPTNGYLFFDSDSGKNIEIRK